MKTRRRSSRTLPLAQHNRHAINRLMERFTSKLTVKSKTPNQAIHCNNRRAVTQKAQATNVPCKRPFTRGHGAGWHPSAYTSGNRSFRNDKIHYVIISIVSWPSLQSATRSSVSHTNASIEQWTPVVTECPLLLRSAKHDLWPIPVYSRDRPKTQVRPSSIVK